MLIYCPFINFAKSVELKCLSDTVGPKIRQSSPQYREVVKGGGGGIGVDDCS